MPYDHYDQTIEKPSTETAYGQINASAIEIEIDRVVEDLHVFIDSANSITGTVALAYKPMGGTEYLDFDGANTITVADDKAANFSEGSLPISKLRLTPSNLSAAANWRVDVKF